MVEVLFPKSRRRWLRFSVRGLMVAVLVIAAGFGWIVDSAEIQRDAVSAIQSRGGSVKYDWEVLSDDSWLRDGKLFGHTWPVKLLGVDYFASVRSVDLDAPESPADRLHIARLKKVEFVNVRGPNVTDAGLTAFEGLNTLCSLWIGNRDSHCSAPFKQPCCAARVTDAGLAIFGKRKSLKYLYLNGTAITDAGLAHLAGLTALSTLSLSDTRITDRGLVHLKEMTQLEILHLDNTTIADSDTANQKELTDAAARRASGTQISDTGIAQLKGLKWLWCLYAGGTAVSREGLSELRRSLPNLLNDLSLPVRGATPVAGKPDRAERTGR